MHGDPPHQSFGLVGRKELLAECGSRLESNNLLVLSGVPGVGKTRIALALSSSKEAKYEFVWWLRAGDEAQLEAAIGRLASAAGVPPSPSSEQTLRNLVGAMRQPGLIVFDDAESLAVLERHLAASGASDVLATTSSDSPQTYLVRGLPASSEVVEFIHSLCGISAKDAVRLIDEVDGRPLLLLHACQFISANNSSVGEYLELLESPGSIFDSWPFQASDYERPQERVIPLSLGHLVEDSIPSRELCELLAMLAPAPIPVNLLEAFDENAGQFLLAAQESFVVIRNLESQTVEVPTLIRAAIREMAGESTSDLRERAWQALETVTTEITEPAHRDYLAEHISHLGVDPHGIVATVGLAIDFDELPLAVTLWRQAYDGGVQEAPDRHNRRRAALADRLGWALLNEGIYREAEATVSRELALANEAGCIPCRAPLLILLGHLSRARRKPENEEIRMYQAAAAALRISGGEKATLAQTLVDVISACNQEIDEGLKKNETLDLSGVVEIGCESLRELEVLRQDLMPAGSAGIDPMVSKGWDRVEENWAEALKGLRAHLDDANDDEETAGPSSASAAPEQVPWSPAFAFSELTNTLLHRDPDLDALVEISNHMVGLRRKVEDPAAARESAEVLDADSRSLRAGLVDQYGADSHAIALADYVEMIAAHLEQDEERAAAACRRFLIGALEATSISRTVALLHKGLSFALEPTPDEGPTDADRTMTRAAPWLARLPDVEAFLWLAFQQWNSSEDLPRRASVYRALHEIRKLGRHGPSIAAHLSHMYGHREHLPPAESLRYHRISVRMYELIGAPVSDWGYGLYCYAHRLLESDRPSASTRRFRESRELLTSVDKGSAAVLHIDEHLNSPNAPYLDGE